MRRARMAPGEARAQIGAPAGSSGRVVAVVLCAGQGTRMGAGRNKVFLPLAGRPVLAHALDAFSRAASIDEIIVVAQRDEIVRCQREVVERYGLSHVRAVIAGGATRHQSEACALALLRARILAREIAIVLVADGARPLVTVADIERVIAAARACGGALLVTPFAASDVVLRLDAVAGATVVPLEGLARAQTPQAFAAGPLLAAFDTAAAEAFEGTDTAATFERLGYPVAAVRGAATNLKITTPDDLPRAEALLALATPAQDAR